MSSNETKRAEFIAGLRAFADLVETDPSIPTPTDADMWAFITSYSTGLDQGQRFDLIHDFADAHDLQVTQERDGDRKTEKHFGPVYLRVIAVADEKPKPRVVTRADARRATPAAA